MLKGKEGRETGTEGRSLNERVDLIQGGRECVIAIGWREGGKKGERGVARKGGRKGRGRKGIRGSGWLQSG